MEQETNDPNAVRLADQELLDKCMANQDRTLEEFIKYCIANPELRFWQAIRNWSDQDFIFFGNATNRRGKGILTEVDGQKVHLEDTFHFTTRDN